MTVVAGAEPVQAFVDPTALNQPIQPRQHGAALGQEDASGLVRRDAQRGRQLQSRREIGQVRVGRADGPSKALVLARMAERTHWRESTQERLTGTGRLGARGCSELPAGYGSERSQALFRWRLRNQ